MTRVKEGKAVMKWLVTVRFVHGQREERAALLPAEQEHVGKLRAQGVIEAIHVGADRSVVWLVMQGESQDHILRALMALPLYPYMALEVAPLLDIGPGRQGESAATSGRPSIAATGE
jgi:muconolactone delta-isomerase